MLNYSTWATRGWCRLERLARELARREDGYILIADARSTLHMGVGGRPAIAHRNCAFFRGAPRVGLGSGTAFWSKCERS